MVVLIGKVNIKFTLCYYLTMIFSNKTRIEEYIIEILDKGPQNGPSILEKATTLHGPTTKQAVYKVLRKLISDEVINKQGTHYSLNRVWLQKIHKFSHGHISEPESVDISNVLNFEDGDSVTYNFKSPFLLDIIWGHLYDIVYEANPARQVVLNYHPHEWLILSRPETEKFWLSQFSQDKKMMLFTIGGSSFLDKRFKKEYSSNYVSINLSESYNLDSNRYLAVLGDYVFEITTNKNFEKKVHELFEKVSNIDEINQKEIVELSKLKYRSKLKLSKNKKKADLWRTKFKKDFYIPKPYYLFEKDK